jgi:DNA-binding transcriptional LysR family regulator
MGVCVLAKWAIEPHVRARTLRTVRLTKLGVRRRWYAATRALKETPVYLREFERFLARAMTSPPDLVAETLALAQGRRLSSV